MDAADSARPMRIALSGSTGLVGAALGEALRREGREVWPIVRRATKDGRSIHWDTELSRFDAEALGTCDAVVHLAGEPIVGRWTEEKKRRVRASRVDSTEALARTLASLDDGPRTLVCASAIGFYGDTGQGEAVDEDHGPGSDFLAEVCLAWERATDAARDGGVRVVNVRIGLVLSRRGGALAAMLTPFGLGLGGPLGKGDQWMSVIGLHDLVRVFEFALDTPTLTGPVNAVAPEPVRNRDFSHALGRALHRPTLLRIPSFAPKLLFGKESAQALALGSVRALPERLVAAGFAFEYGSLDAAMQHALAP